MNVAKKTFGILSAAALAFTMAACSEASATGDGAAAAGSTRPVSPLNEIMDQVWGTGLSQEEQQREFDEQQLRREEIIAQCMNELGFEYTPNTSSGGRIMVADENMWRPDDRDWVAQWGYGAVNSPWNAQQTEDVDPDLVNEEQWFDANQELQESMSESELRAWQAALWGDIDWENLPPEVAESTGDGGWMIIDNEAFNEMQGCSGRANNAVNTNSRWDVMNSDEFRPLMDAMNAMWSTVSESPEMATIDREWASCMADAGHPGFNTQNDAQSSIWDAQNELWNGLDDWNWEQGSPNPSNHPAWAELAEQEIELALADLDCRESTDLRNRQQEIQFAIERQFIADHRADLDALVAAVAQRG